MVAQHVDRFIERQYWDHAVQASSNVYLQVHPLHLQPYPVV